MFKVGGFAWSMSRKCSLHPSSRIKRLPEPQSSLAPFFVIALTRDISHEAWKSCAQYPIMSDEVCSEKYSHNNNNDQHRTCCGTSNAHRVFAKGRAVVQQQGFQTDENPLSWLEIFLRLALGQSMSFANISCVGFSHFSCDCRQAHLNFRLGVLHSPLIIHW